jgi:hypothetical protein
MRPGARTANAFGYLFKMESARTAVLKWMASRTVL